MAPRAVRSAAVVTACVGAAMLAAPGATAVAPDGAILGGHYRVVTTQGGQAGVIVISRTMQRMVPSTRNDRGGRDPRAGRGHPAPAGRGGGGLGGDGGLALYVAPARAALGDAALHLPQCAGIASC